MKRPPPISLELDFVYGFQAFDKRKTLHYAHIYCDSEFAQGVDEQGFSVRRGKHSHKYDILKNLSKNRNIMGYQKSMNTKSIQSTFDGCKDLAYDVSHENCKRFFVYFCSRIGIVYDPVKNI